MKKPCQIDAFADKNFFVCAEVFKRTGHSLTVSKEVCDSCTEETIKKACNFILKQHGQKSISKRPTMLNQISNFTQAVKRFASSGFKMVSKQVYEERRVCCTTCGSGNRCPYCGCFLSAKAWLKSENACPSPKTYSKLPKYPPRNYWEVCNQKTSVIIAARNENLLNKTIQNLIDNATGKIEFIVILDGYEYNLIENERVKVIKHKEAKGRRVSINEAARKATGDYLFVIDAHCTMSKGWDTKMKCTCNKNTLVTSIIKPLKDDMTGFTPGEYSFVYLNSDYVEKWWGNHKDKKDWKPVEDQMCFTGCAWMIRKDYYWKLNGYDESFSEYGYDGPEWTLKVWLNEELPGKIVLRTDVVCGHVFGTNENARLYGGKMLVSEEYKRRMQDKWGDKIHKLVEKFQPVPTWGKEEVDSPKKLVGKVVEKQTVVKKEESVTKDKEENVIYRVVKVYEPVDYVGDKDANKQEVALDIVKDSKIAKIEVEKLVDNDWERFVIDEPKKIEEFVNNAS